MDFWQRAWSMEHGVEKVRFDKGALWENFLLSERMKANHYQSKFPDTYFWRSHDQAKIDYIEEQDGILNAFELKWKDTRTRFPDSFLKAYPNHLTMIVHQGSFETFLGEDSEIKDKATTTI